MVTWNSLYGNEGSVGNQPEVELNYGDQGLGRALSIYVTAAIAILVAAVWLAMTGDHLAEKMGWEASFMGTQFLAISTSLPEIATSFAALRLQAPDLAITNLLGSNIFNMGFEVCSLFFSRFYVVGYSYLLLFFIIKNSKKAKKRK